MYKKIILFLITLASPFVFHFENYHSNNHKIQNSASNTNYFTSFDGTKIAYSDEGNGFPVLLVHGFISNRTSWNNTAIKEELTSKGYRVIIPDLRGNGESDKPHDENAYKENSEIKDLKLLMDQLKIKKYFAIGYSRGSIVLAKLLTKDKRIEKAVLGGMGADFTNPDWERRIMFAEAFNGNSDLYPETKGALNYAKSIGADTLILHYLQKYQPVTNPKELNKIKKPILVIAGDQDMDNGDPFELKSFLKKGQVIIVKGNHNETSKTQEFADEVIKFLNS